MFKYPRTAHVKGSRFQSGDYDLGAIPFSELVGKNLVIEEKIDGANCGISFDDDGNMQLQSRGHYLRGGPREKHFDILKQWASTHQEMLYITLGSRYVMYAEWMAAKHTMFYDALPHYFMEFDILDTTDGSFLGTSARLRALHGNASIKSVKVLATGKFNKLDDIKLLIGRSNFVTDEHHENLVKAARDSGVSIEDAIKSTDMTTTMEGLYIKWEENDQVLGRYKYIRESFTNSILDQDEHWLNRPIVHNKLLDGHYEKMFEQDV